MPSGWSVCSALPRAAPTVARSDKALASVAMPRNFDRFSSSEPTCARAENGTSRGETELNVPCPLSMCSPVMRLGSGEKSSEAS